MGVLDGKIAVITGGNSGIGLATAKRFVSEGAFVYITGLRQSELDLARKEIGSNVVAVRADVSELSDLDKLYALIEQERDCVDIVFANAGSGEFAPLGAITEDHYYKTFDTDVKGVLFTVQKASPLLPDGASVILNASIASIKGVQGWGVYAAAKAAVRSFARTWTNDLRDRRIRVNVLSPGLIQTPGLDGIVETEEQRVAMRKHLTDGVPLGRIGDADEIAKATVFLASDAASYISGVELFVDGGYSQV